MTKRRFFAIMGVSSLLIFYCWYKWKAGNIPNFRPAMRLSLSFNSSLDSDDSLPDTLPQCSEQGAGPVQLIMNVTDEDLTNMENSEEILPGGFFSPANCTPTQRVAVILPFRDRDEHLRIYLNHLHKVLRRQGIEYQIFISEQIVQIDDGALFNRGKLFNVGVAEALNMGDWDCLILSDVDVLPEDDRISYTCKDVPQQIGWRISKFNYKLPYKGFVSGVIAITPASYKIANGFSNHYWGWGGEDDEFGVRLFKLTGLERPENPQYRFKMHVHEKDEKDWKKGHSCRAFLSRRFNKTRQAVDGINSLRYEVELVKQRFYMQILANLKYDDEEKKIVKSLCAGH